MIATPQSQHQQEIAFVCSHCWTQLMVPVDLAGIEAPCPRCGQPTRSPAVFEPGSGGPILAEQASWPAEDLVPPPRRDIGQVEVEEVGASMGEIEDFEGLDDRGVPLREVEPPPPPPAVQRNDPFPAKRRIDAAPPDPAGPGQRRRRRQRRRRKAVHRSEQAFKRVTESKAFRRTRLVLSVLGVAVAVATVIFMRQNGWHLRKPHLSPPPVPVLATGVMVESESVVQSKDGVGGDGGGSEEKVVSGGEAPLGVSPGAGGPTDPLDDGPIAPSAVVLE